MKRILSGVMVAVCVLGGAGLAWAQQAEQPTYHVVVTYIKTLPGMQEAYREQVLGASKKFYEEMLKEQPTLVHWSSARVMYPGLENNDYDYVAASIYAGPPPEPSTPADAVFQRASGMTRVEYQKKLAGLRTVVASELLRSMARVAAPGTQKEGDFRVSQQLRILPNMGSEFSDLMEAQLRPMMEVRRTNGELKTWSMWTRVFPSGAGTDYDALGVTVYKDLASAVKGLDGAKTAEAFAKANPGKSYGSYVSNARDYARIENRSITQVVALVERPAPPSK